MNFSDRLKSIRIDRGYTQRTLGELVGVSEMTIGNWERGVKQPSLNFLLALSDALHVSVDFLIGSDRKFFPFTSGKETA